VSINNCINPGPILTAKRIDCREPGLTTEEAKELELDEQPKPTRHLSGHHSPPMSYNEEPGRDHKKRQRENEIARNKFSFIAGTV